MDGPERPFLKAAHLHGADVRIVIERRWWFWPAMIAAIPALLLYALYSRRGAHLRFVQLQAKGWQIVTRRASSR